MAWFRIDSNWRRHVKVRRVGYWGAAVCEIAWEIAKDFGRVDGDISDEWDIDYISDWASIPAENKESARAGMIACERAGLIVKKNGSVKIHNWELMQLDRSTDRVRAFRQRQRSGETDETFHETDETIETLGTQHYTTLQNNTEHTTTQNKKREKSGSGIDHSDPEVWQFLTELRKVFLRFNPNHSWADQKTWDSNKNRMYTEAAKRSKSLYGRVLVATEWALTDGRFSVTTAGVAFQKLDAIEKLMAEDMATKATKATKPVITQEEAMRWSERPAESKDMREPVVRDYESTKSSVVNLLQKLKVKEGAM